MFAATGSRSPSRRGQRTGPTFDFPVTFPAPSLGVAGGGTCIEMLDLASLGQMRLLRPALTKAALAANDRLKLYLAVVQAADAHAAEPNMAPVDLRREFAAAQVAASWLRGPPGMAERAEFFRCRDCCAWSVRCGVDLRIMARPLSEGADLTEVADSGIFPRLEYWHGWLDALSNETLEAAQDQPGHVVDAPGRHAGPSAGRRRHENAIDVAAQAEARAVDVPMEVIERDHPARRASCRRANGRRRSSGRPLPVQ